jgi:hypothetical protein
MVGQIARMTPQVVEEELKSKYLTLSEEPKDQNDGINNMNLIPSPPHINSFDPHRRSSASLYSERTQRKTFSCVEKIKFLGIHKNKPSSTARSMGSWR